jgi:hypothetical protein
VKEIRITNDQCIIEGEEREKETLGIVACQRFERLASLFVFGPIGLLGFKFIRRKKESEMESVFTF